MRVLIKEFVSACTRRKNQGGRGSFFKNLCRRDVIKRTKERKTSRGSKHKFSRPFSVNKSKKQASAQLDNWELMGFWI